MASSQPPRPRDRLSDLPDFLLGEILSFLPSKEAGRAAALSHRWRNIFCNVHTVSFEELQGARDNDDDSFFYEAYERKNPSEALLDDVCSAFLCRRRCAGHHVPLRRFRLAFNSYVDWDRVHVNQWLSYVLRHSSQELHLDVRFWIGPICKHRNGPLKEEADSGSDNSEDDEPPCKAMMRRDSYALPRRLFTCTVIRTLCVTYCRLKLPAAINLPFLETLSIMAPSYCDGSRSIQRLISSCPRLVDLTLEAVHCLKRVSILDKRLHRLAIRCCHNLKSVDTDTSELRSLDYCGVVPAESLLSMHGTPGILSCTVDLCIAHSKEAEFDGFRRFMGKIADTKHLHLHHRSLESRFFLRLPSFSSLTRLVLQGPVESCGTVVVVGQVLEQTPNLEALSLCMEEHVACKEEDDVDEYATVPDTLSFSMSCLRHRVKEIYMVHYKGSKTQRMMARLLFSNALVLERMCVSLVRGIFGWQSNMKNEIDSWVVADAEKIFL